MESIFTDENILHEQSISLREFVDKASQIVLKKDLNIDRESKYFVSAGTHFRLEFPDGKKFPKNRKFSAVPNIARELQEHFDLEISSNFSENIDLEERRERYTLDTGNPAGIMGYVSLSSAAQDFARFIIFLKEENFLSPDVFEGAKIYAKATRHHYLHRGLNESDSGEEDVNLVLESLQQNKNIIVEGVAGSGKSHMLQGLRSSGAYGENGNRIDVVVFHPSTSYEEFVSGIRPNFTKQEGESDFVTYEGVFVQMCNRAAQNPEQPYLLFIDEINRANTSRVFGDLMLVLEKTKSQRFKGLPTEGRDGALFEASVEKMPGEYVRLQTPIIKNGKEYNKLAVPSNLHVLGTMNTTDRSVGTIDLALRRRFHWITQEPYTAEELKEAMGDEYPGAVASWYEKANGILLTKVGPDARLGHAYFFGKDGDEEAIAESLITQLLEIIFTFNIKDNVLQEIGVPPIPQYAGKKLGYRGEGLGRRPSLDNSQSSAAPQADEPAPDNSGDDSASENQ